VVATCAPFTFSVLEIAIVLPPEVYVVGMWFATGHAALVLHGARARSCRAGKAKLTPSRRAIQTGFGALCCTLAVVEVRLILRVACFKQRSARPIR